MSGELTDVEAYAVELVHVGATHVAEDDTDEDGVFADGEQHRAACDLGLDMAKAIKENPVEFRNWCRVVSR